MVPDLWIALGGAIGAFVRAMTATDQITWSKKTLVDTVTGALVTVAVWNLGALGVLWGLVPAETYKVIAGALARNPLAAVAITALPGLAGVDLLRSLAERFAPKLNKAL